VILESFPVVKSIKWKSIELFISISTLDKLLVCWHNYQGCVIMPITFEEAEIRAKIMKAMAHPVRLMVIDFLKKKEHSFSEIFDLFQLDKSTVSKHLLVLKEAGIVSSRKDRSDMIYKLDVPCVTDFFTCVTAVIQTNVKKQQVCLCKPRISPP
jgi:ArsR family transcriptional regulator